MHAFPLFSVFKANESLPLQALLTFSRNQYGGSELLFGSSLAFPVFTQRFHVIILPCCSAYCNLTSKLCLWEAGGCLPGKVNQLDEQ